MSACIVDGCNKAPVKLQMCGGHYMRKRRHGDALAGRTENGMPEKFLAEAVRRETNDCIIWPFGLSSAGYATINVKEKKERVSRLVLLERVGPAPSPQHVAAHAPVLCHNPKCINYRHLRWATRAENEADKLLDGTHSRGEAHGQSTLSETDVLAIRKSDKSVAALADLHKIHPETIRKIRRGTRWGWL